MVESDRYGEVMRSALRLLGQQESHDEMIRKAIIVGLESGEISLTLKDIAEKRERAHNI